MRILTKMRFLFLIIVIILLPIGFKVVFEVPILRELFSYEQQVKDVVDIYVSIFSTLGTLFLGCIAWKQNEVANEQNRRLLQLEETSKKVYIQLDREKISFNKIEQRYEIYIYGKNVSNVPLVEWTYQEAGKINDKYGLNIETIRGDVAYVSSCAGNPIALHIVDQHIKNEEFVYCFKIISTGIYGYQTTQVFNILVKNGMIFDVYTVEELPKS